MAKLDWTKEEVLALTPEQYQALTDEERVAVREVRVKQIMNS